MTSEQAGPSSPSPFAGKSRAQLVVLACAAAVAVGCFMPWIKIVLFGSITASGVDGGDGWVFLGGAAVLAFLAWRGEPGVPALVVSLLGVGGFVYERWNIGRSEEIPIQIGSGLWVILIASVVASATAIHTLTPAPAEPPGPGLAPILQRYRAGVGLAVVFLVAALVIGRDDHDSEIGFRGFDDDDTELDFGFEEDDAPPVEVTVLDSGFSNYTAFDDTIAATAGALVRNDGDEDLGYLEVVFTFQDGDGEPIATETGYAQGGIEAGETVAVSLSSVELPEEAASVDVQPVTEASFMSDGDATAIPLGPVQIEADDFGGHRLSGTARNPSDEATITSASLQCVVLHDGAIVGGTGGYLDSLTPGASIAWDASFDADDVPIDDATCTATTSDL